MCAYMARDFNRAKYTQILVFFALVKARLINKSLSYSYSLLFHTTFIIL